MQRVFRAHQVGNVYRLDLAPCIVSVKSAWRHTQLPIPEMAVAGDILQLLVLTVTLLYASIVCPFDTAVPDFNKMLALRTYVSALNQMVAAK